MVLEHKQTDDRFNAFFLLTSNFMDPMLAKRWVLADDVDKDGNLIQKGYDAHAEAEMDSLVARAYSGQLFKRGKEMINFSTGKTQRYRRVDFPPAWIQRWQRLTVGKKNRIAPASRSRSRSVRRLSPRRLKAQRRVGRGIARYGNANLKVRGYRKQYKALKRERAFFRENRDLWRRDSSPDEAYRRSLERLSALVAQAIRDRDRTPSPSPEPGDPGIVHVGAKRPAPKSEDFWTPLRPVFDYPESTSKKATPRKARVPRPRSTSSDVPSHFSATPIPEEVGSYRYPSRDYYANVFDPGSDSGEEFEQLRRAPVFPEHSPGLARYLQPSPAGSQEDEAGSEYSY